MQVRVVQGFDLDFVKQDLTVRSRPIPYEDHIASGYISKVVIRDALDGFVCTRIMMIPAMAILDEIVLELWQDLVEHVKGFLLGKVGIGQMAGLFGGHGEVLNRQTERGEIEEEGRSQEPFEGVPLADRPH